jgi:hypothetical protein
MGGLVSGSGDSIALRSPRLTAMVLVAVTLSLALAAVGAYLAVGMFADGRHAAALQRDASVALDGPAAIAQDVPTSFGVVAVESMTQNAGPTAKALAGMTHGVGNLVPPNKIQVDATVTLTNLESKLLHYSPQDFQLYATRAEKPGIGARSFRLSRASIPPGTLQPNASIDATLTFVVPRDGRKLWMTFNDPARGPPVVFDLGRTDRTPPGALNRYHAHQR